MGYDAGLIFGYDAGIVRAELDLVLQASVSQDEITDRHFRRSNGPLDTRGSFDADGSTRYIAIMANLLLDVGNEDGLSFYAGPGLGFAWGKFDIDGISTIP